MEYKWNAQEVLSQNLNLHRSKGISINSLNKRKWPSPVNYEFLSRDD